MSEANFREEDKLGKAYDSKLLGRLLRFAKPHKWLLSACIVLVLLITASELAGPYLIKVAIDDHINGLQRPMHDMTGEDLPQGVRYTQFQGRILVRDRELAQAAIPESGYRDSMVFQIRAWKDDYYLVTGTIEKDNGQLKLIDEDRTYFLSGAGDVFPAQKLNPEQVAVFKEQDVSALIYLAGIYLLLITLGFAMNSSQIYCLNYVAQRIIYTMRRDVFSHLQSLSFKFFDRNPVGRLVTRVTNDTETLNEMYSSVLVNLFKDIFLLVGIVLIMWQLNYKLALLSFVTLPLIIAVTIIYRWLVRGTLRELRVRLARINASMNENLTGMRIVQIFRREKQQYDRMNEINYSHFLSNKRELHLSSLYRPIMDFIYAIGLSTILWWGGHGIVQGALEFGVLYAFIDYINRFFKPINDMTEKYTIMQQAMVSSERIFMLLDEKDDLPDTEHPISLERIRGEIEFKDVSFAYNEGEWVLNNVNLKIMPGETVAFVGATGAGKSSIISLLCRFYDVQRGAITIDGIDLRDVSKRELRKQIGVVLQDVFLFSDDIKSNIRLRNEKITDEQIRQVSRFVNADTFIDRLPNGYNEEVKERGATLSAGQRQLLAFARTLAFDPAVLVLDEATANIDTETELLIQDALHKISKNRTTLIIAHRLSTIQHADKIVVMHKGRIREIGTHQELLRNGEMYKVLYELQYKETYGAG